MFQCRFRLSPFSPIRLDFQLQLREPAFLPCPTDHLAGHRELLPYLRQSAFQAVARTLNLAAG